MEQWSLFYMSTDGYDGYQCKMKVNLRVYRYGIECQHQQSFLFLYGINAWTLNTSLL